MPATNDLQRFLQAQERDYATARAEIRAGRKRSHWIWYIFPQIQGLGLSTTSRFYAIHDLSEAAAYLRHPVLGQRLIELSNDLLQLSGNDAHAVFGSPDELKLRSSMTLFAAVEGTDPVFQKVIAKFFGGTMDARTLQLLGLSAG